MGDTTENILATSKLSQKESEKFGKHFKTSINVIYKRATFKKRKKKERKSIDAFITDLYFSKDM